jgi:AraC-like DNA-binding protein
MGRTYLSFGPRSRVIGRAGKIAISSLELGGRTDAASIGDSARDSEHHLRLEIVRRGRMAIRQDGETLVFGAGDMLLLDPSLEFGRLLDEPVQILAVHISKHALNVRGLSFLFTSACYAIRQTEDMAAMRELLLTVTGLMDSVSDVLLERMGNQLLDLMDVVFENAGLASTVPCANVVVLRATRLITQRIFDRDLNMSSIANLLNISVSSLSRAFRRYGVSTMRHVNALRLEHAGQLLADRSDLAIGDVAMRCGFVDSAHFSRVFKQKYRMTPRQYAKDCASRKSQAAAESQEADHARTSGSM